MKRRVLVTGATGCVGRHALPVLVARGWEVHAVTSRNGPDAAEEIIWHRADLLNPRELNATIRSAQATHLLHLAWYVAPGQWATASENFEWVHASLELLRAFREQGGEG